MSDDDIDYSDFSTKDFLYFCEENGLDPEEEDSLAQYKENEDYISNPMRYYGVSY